MAQKGRGDILRNIPLISMVTALVYIMTQIYYLQVDKVMTETGLGTAAQIMLIIGAALMLPTAIVANLRQKTLKNQQAIWAGVFNITGLLLYAYTLGSGLVSQIAFWSIIAIVSIGGIYLVLRLSREQ